MSSEFDYLLNWNTKGIKSYSDQMAMNCKVTEWFDTPAGSIYGKPDWGHRLEQYKHEPHSPATASLIEMDVVLDITRDIPDVIVNAIKVQATDMDRYDIYIYTNDDVIETGVSL